MSTESCIKPSSVQKKFYNDFLAATAVLSTNPGPKHDTPDTAAGVAGPEVAKHDGQAASAEKDLAASATQAFRQNAEAFVMAELNARLVILTQDGMHGELREAVSNTELYKTYPRAIAAS